ncbi:MAG: WYL domain-containing protein [Pasteurella oralis]|uniref:helix-turn-helix transcriptional regulator n=1 Tax=Pasteurella oralis TaxID=1071947 RepID=UPI0026FBAF1A|nr:WYL domain-containing protein [Pasteurella oralis]
MTELAKSITGMQKERLAHIEFLALFIGKVCRKDIMDRFDISQAAATRDLSLYAELAPNNLIYDPRAKHYIPSNQFKSYLGLSTNKCLNTLATGYGNYIESTNRLIDYIDTLYEPNLDITICLIRAIYQNKPVLIEYISKNGRSNRIICPFALINTGLRWHTRAYDRQKNDFRDFVINRITNIEILNQPIQEQETSNNDEQWNKYIELELQVHPKKYQIKDMIEQEYKISNGVMIKTVRKAIAGYLLNSWRVDATSEAKHDRPDIYLHLKNATQVKNAGVNNLSLAENY